MSLSTVLDVAIGLAFIYLLLGLLASALQEAVAGFLKLRARALQSALRKLLDTSNASGAGTLFKDVFSHPLIKPSPTALPSYIAARNFGLALFEALRSRDGSLPLFSQVEAGISKLPDSAARRSLEAFVVESSGEIETLKARVETWFDDAMDRLGGVYKRYSHAFALSFGLAVAVGCNIDSINIAKVLWRDPVARAAVVADAQKYVADNPNINDKLRNDELKKQLDKLPIPAGWPDGFSFPPNDAGWWALLGWLVTALAVSLGAPFWFDVLQKFINIRATGPKPDPSNTGQK